MIKFQIASLVAALVATFVAGTAVAQSDLIPQNIITPATVAPGATFTPSWSLANIGSAAANSTSTTVVRINQSATSAAGTNLASIATPALAGGASAAQSASVTAPTAQGTYYVWIIADDFGNVTNQSNTSNDLQHSGPVSVMNVGQSDLIPQNIITPATVAPGATFTPSWSLANIGSAAANSTSTTVVRINQSATSAAGTNLASIATPALAGGASAAQSASVTAPTAQGTYYVWIIADDFGNVTNQSNTSNDLQHSGPVSVMNVGQSDLIPQNIITPATVAPGATFTPSWSLANIGSAAANSTSTTVVRINQSATSAAGTNLASIATPALAGGASAAQSASVTAPTAQGTYYVWIIADDFGNVTNQSNTSNDLQHSGPVSVMNVGQSDLIPQNIITPATVAPGATFTPSWSLANIGSAAANSTSTTVVRINQSATSAAGTNLASIATPALAGGASAAQSASVTAPTAQGTYYVWIIADDFGNVTNQSNTSNDLQHSGPVSVMNVGQSDLIPQNIITPATVAPGATFTPSWSLANIGSAAANSTSTTVVRINQSATSAAGTNLASIATPALAGGASAAQSASVTAPTAPGTYYVWIVADDFGKVTNQSNKANDLQHSGPVSVEGSGAKWVWPTGSDADRGVITQDFEAYGVVVSGKYHTGFDIAKSPGSVFAAQDGDVVSFTLDSPNCYTHPCTDHYDGNTIVLSHANGLYTQYQHMLQIDSALDSRIDSNCAFNTTYRAYNCAAGKVHLLAGDPIGLVGDTGCVRLSPPCGAHLHFEVKTFPSLGAGKAASEFGYTTEFPITIGFLDPVDYLDGSTPLLPYASVTITSAGNGHLFHYGPNISYSSLNIHAVAGQVYTARETAPPTPNCSMGWYDIFLGAPYYVDIADYFHDPAGPAGSHNLPDVWFCHGNAGVNYANP